MRVKVRDGRLVNADSGEPVEDMELVQDEAEDTGPGLAPAAAAKAVVREQVPEPPEGDKQAAFFAARERGAREARLNQHQEITRQATGAEPGSPSPVAASEADPELAEPENEPSADDAQRAAEEGVRQEGDTGEPEQPEAEDDGEEKSRRKRRSKE